MIFDPFNDFNTAGYLRNLRRLKDPAAVKNFEHICFEFSIEDALNLLASRQSIDYETVLKVHEILFSDCYPWAGKDRNEPVPHLAVFKGALQDENATVFEHPNAIRMSVDYALKLAANKTRFKERPGEVMGQLAFSHPFLDGNGRTILLVFMELSWRANFTVDWSKTNKDDYLQALSAEIKDPFKGHLDRYLSPLVVEIDSRENWPNMISGIRGFDGLDKEGMAYENLDNPQVKQIYKAYGTRYPTGPASENSED